MLFNSFIFIFIFYPVVLIGWFGLNNIKKYTLAKLFVVLMSLWFYSYTNYWYLILILSSMIGNYAISYLIQTIKSKNNGSDPLIKLTGAVGIIFNLALLFYFKYYNFFISNINAIFKTDYFLRNITLPLGISFFTFQQIGFLADRMRGKAEHYSIIDYMLFVSYFPQLVAGPIVKHGDMIPQFNDLSLKKINWENVARGMVIFTVGLSKKVLIADNLALIANYCFSNINDLDSLGAIVGMISYTFQIFFDFSGYCDMAMGLGKMMNIKILVNFDSPYKSRSVKEFWRRWHITLNKFFTEYVYIPLGGNRKGKIRAFINVMVIFFLSGLWHGANWTFVIWGVCHGICVAIQSLYDAKEAKSKVILFCKWLVTFLFVNFAWVLFASNNIKTALEYYKKIFSLSWNGSIMSVAYSTDSSILHVPLSLISVCLAQT